MRGKWFSREARRGEILTTAVAKTDEIGEKTERLRAMLAKESLGGVLINTQHNFAWLSAGGSNGIDTSREAGAGTILVRNDGKRFLLANCIEMPRLLAEEVAEKDFEPIEFAWEEEKAAPEFPVELALSLLAEQKSLGSDLPLGKACRPIEGAVSECRYELTSDEIERYRTLGQDAGMAIEAVARTVHPGQTELEIARKTVDALAGCEASAVVMLVAADQRLQRFRHPVPSNQRWERVVMIVVCARRRGLIASLTRIVAAGALPDDLRKRTRAAATVNANLFAATRPGCSGAQLYNVAESSYAAAGYAGEERLHHQGGACGYRTRDWVAHPSSTQTVRAHQAFAWNPSITGTKVEETCIVFEDRIETITSRPDWPKIDIGIEGQVYSLPDILSL
jgi:antitoxin VapB